MHFRDHRQLEVYKLAYSTSMEIFELTKAFPPDEKYSLTSQLRRCSRAVCGIFAEAYRKRRYPKSFIAKLNESEGEAAESQTWLDYARDCNYLPPQTVAELDRKYDRIIGMLVNMQRAPDKWSV
ncbi:MAG: four helix bundle protein [Bacteroidota bacterium]